MIHNDKYYYMTVLFPEIKIPILRKEIKIPILRKVEIVMNELRKLKMSADFFANTSHDICRCPAGV